MAARFYDTFADYKGIVYNALDYTHDRFLVIAEQAKRGAGADRKGNPRTPTEEDRRTWENYEATARNARAAKLTLQRAFNGEENRG